MPKNHQRHSVKKQYHSIHNKSTFFRSRGYLKMTNKETRKNIETVFITFGAGRTGWRRAARRLGREAYKTKLFKSIHVFDENWISTHDIKIYNQIQSYRMSGNYKGFGYWAWKAAILKWAGSRYPQDQILYIDGGHHISSEVDDQNSIRDLLISSVINDGLAWQLNARKEVEFCKQEVLEKIDGSQLFLEDNQIQASFICLPPSKKRVKFINEFYHLATEENGFNFSDELRVAQSEKFQVHRHDQAVFSLLWKKYQFGFEYDKTYPPVSNSFPILATRNNTGINSNSPEILIKVEKNLNLVLDKILMRK
jgi:hypothetical protein